MLKYEQLKEILPQAQPFLLLDYVESYDTGRVLTAVKNLSVNEWPFESHRVTGSQSHSETRTHVTGSQSHTQGQKHKEVTSQPAGRQGYSQSIQYPNTLLIEAAAQAALVLYHVSMVKPGQARPRYALGRVKAEFSRAASIGEQVRLQVRAGKIMKDSGYADVSLEADKKEMGEVTVFYTVGGN